MSPVCESWLVVAGQDYIWVLLTENPKQIDVE